MEEDTNFPEVISKLNEIHQEFPDLRFGRIIQTAVDKYRTGKNIDLHDKSTKDILAALVEFQRKTRYDRGRE